MATGSQGMRERRGVVGLAVVLGMLAGCGQETGGTTAGSTRTPAPIAPASGPCREAEATVERARAVYERTFGGGPEGREASRTIAEAVERRPGCFDDEFVEYARALRDMLPASAAEAEALRAAEQACGGTVGRSSTSLVGVEDPTLHDTPEAALAAEADTEAGLPDGQRQRSFEQGDRVGFDYHDQGEFTGWVLVERLDGGWFVRRTLICESDSRVTEQPTPG